MRITNRYKDKGKYHRYIEKDVISTFLENNNICKTAKKFNVSHLVINKILDINGYTHLKRGECRLNISKLSSEKEEIIKLYKEGLTSMALAKQYNVYHATITRLLKQWNVKLRTRQQIQKDNFLKYDKLGCIKKNYRLEELKDTIIELYLLKQKTIWDIEEITHIGHTSILRHLHKWNIKLRESPFSKNKPIYIADDGHKVRSSYELKVDNWLYHHSIPHTTNQSIGNYYYDFKVNEYFIEIWGMIQHEHYKKRMIKKIDFYKINNLKIISLFPKDDFQQKLSFLINLYSKNQKLLVEYYEQ